MNIKKNLPIYYLVAFAVVFVVLAISPLYRYMWVVENVIIVITILGLVLTYRKFRFSNLSYTLFFIYAVLVEIGAHYTYSEVPIDFLMSLFDWQRNNYDRIVHFAYGFLLAVPFAEIFERTSKVKSRFWVFVFPILIAFGTGAMYEVLEWLFAVFSDPGATDAFLGSQGDIWDAQKDTFLAGIGAFIIIVFYMIFRKRQPKSSSEKLINNKK